MTDVGAKDSIKEVNLLRVMDVSKKVLVVGPIIVNEYISGSCKRIAADFPIPVFEQSTRTYEIGGPGNVVKNLQAIGLDVDMLTMVGERDQYVADTMQGERIDTSGTVTCPGYSVAKKIRYVSNGYVMFRVNEGDEDFAITENNEEKIVSTFREMLENVGYDVVVLSDYRFGMLSEYVTSSIISLAKSKGIPVLADPPKFGSYDKFKGCTHFKPNLDEAKYFLSRNIASESEIRDACAEISTRLDSPYTIITLAERGIALYDQTKDTFNIMPIPDGTNVVDVSGAGDTALAALAFGIACNISLKHTCRLANQCAANVIQKQGGSVTVDMLEIVREHGRILTSKTEVTNLKHLLKGRGSVALVIDSFSPSTNRQLRVLKKARELEGYVLVAVNMVKHAGDTMDNESDNDNPNLLECITEMLASNKNVDFVIGLENVDREWLIETVQPDYLSDNTIEEGSLHKTS